jgi:SAM-dependent methyltransferase
MNVPEEEITASGKKPSHQYQQYWDRNIDKWGELYLDISHGHETLVGPAWFSAAYNASIGRLERKLMADRYARTIAFIDAYVKPGTVFSDLGCGTGIFVVEALRRGAIVNAIDFSQSSLNITRKNVNRHFPGGQVNYFQANAQVDQLPHSDVTLAMGLTPYLSDLEAFMQRALPATKLWFCLFIDPEHWANRLRSALPFLNVRQLQYYSREDVDRLYGKYFWKLRGRETFATGYIDLAGE